MRLTLKVWFIIAAFSTLLYAFAGIALWPPTNPDDLRATILFLFHLFGLVAYPISRINV